MDYTVLTQLITSVGFPIVACVYLAVYVKHNSEENRKLINDMQTQHMAEVKQLSETIQNNTLAIQHLCDKLNV